MGDERSDPPEERALEGRPGRFPHNDIITLLDVNRRFNLAESTAQDLKLGELVELAGFDRLMDLRLGYGSSLGLPALRDAVARRSKVPADQVLTTTGTALGLAMLALELFAEEGEAALFTPCFPPSRDLLSGIGARICEVPLRFEQGYAVDLDRFAAALSYRVKLVSLASPQNPSGVRTGDNMIRSMLSVMAERAPEAVLFVDETYRESTYGGPPPPSAAPLDPRIVTGGSVSKAHGSPGLRTGWLTVPDPKLRERLATAKMNLVISGSPLDETLAAVVLDHGEALLEPRRALLREALDLVAAWQESEKDRINWVRPDGGALCAMRLDPDRFDDESVAAFWKALPDRELQLAGGTWFGESARTFRLGFGYLPLEALEEALGRISNVLAELDRR